jgi:HAMP domain-containing protein
MWVRRSLVLAAAVAACLAGGSSARTTPLVELLDSYAAGRFDAVVRSLAATTEFDELLKQFRRDAPGWIAAAGPTGRARRELTAATVALEAGRAGARHEWKWIQRQPRMCVGTECHQPLDVLYWKAPPLLIEWGCELLRRGTTPRPAERWWQLAALAVAQRAEDPQFLIGDPHIGQGFAAGEIGNTKDEIKHLEHVTPRFPNEMRFVLAQGIARDRDLPQDARRAYRALEHDPDVGGEAMMRLGAMQVRRRSNYMMPGMAGWSGAPDVSAALDAFARAERLTRDPYVIFLARYFKGQLLDRQDDRREAEAAYRGAVAAVPHAQSATLALATLVVRDGRRSEAHQLVQEMLTATPRPPDPWRAYVHADDRFWPYLVARLRAEIAR